MMGIIFCVDFFFQNKRSQKSISGTLSVLIWVQTVCIGTKVALARV